MPPREPEVNALIRFAFAHPEIVAVWSFGLNDNLKGNPTTVPADAPELTEIIKAFSTATTPKGETPKAEAPKDEPKPEVPKEEPAKKAEAPPADAPKAKGKAQGKGQGGRGGFTKGAGGGGAAGGSRPVVTGPRPGGDDRRRPQRVGLSAVRRGRDRLEALGKARGCGRCSGLDRRRRRPLARMERQGDGRLGLRAVPRGRPPEIGKVEVGGWKPGVRLNPPIEQVDAIVESHLAFLKDLAGRMPSLAIKEAKAEAKGGGIFEIKATVENTGTLPTALAQGVTTRKAAPVLVKLLDLGDAKLLSGRALNRINALAGQGGTQEYRWLVLVPEGKKTITIEASCPKAGAAKREIVLP